MRLVPRTRSSRTLRGKSDRELRVQRGTRTMELLVALRFRSSYLNALRVLTNFGIGPLAVLILAFVITAGPAAAQGYPSRPIKFIAPITAGSGTDVLARALADRLTVALGQPVV